MNFLRGYKSERLPTVLGFLLPALSIYAIFVILPIVHSLYYSLFEWSGISPVKRFLGLSNFKELIWDPVFWLALKNNFLLVITSLATQLPLGLALALLLTSGIKGKGFLRTIYFSPMVMSSVAIGLLWSFIYNPIFGILNATLKAMGLGSLTHGWLGESSTALWAVITTICWRFTGFYMVLFMAAIEGIPEEIYEAASIDGASPWKSTIYITIPMLTGTIRVAAILSLVGSLKYFDLIWVMTMGGPVHASELVATYMYKQAFSSFRMGYGSALAFTLFAIAFVAAVAAILLTTKKGEA